LHVRDGGVAGAVRRWTDGCHALHRDDVFTGFEADVHGKSRPADLARPFLVFRERDIECVADAALVAGAGRDSITAEVAEKEPHEPADAGIRLAPDFHHALAIIQIEVL